MSIPSAWPQVLDFFGTPPAVEPSVGRLTSNAGTLLERVLPLRGLAAVGAAVWLLHHPRKGVPAAGQAARGSGALPGCADIVLEMHWYASGSADDCRRRLYGWSRFEETPRQLVIELTADGRDYLCRGPAADEEYARGWQALWGVLAAAPTKLTQKEILQDWPGSSPRLSEMTLWRWEPRARKRRPKPGARLTQPRVVAKLAHNRSKWY
jgi:hypothetical protein